MSSLGLVAGIVGLTSGLQITTLSGVVSPLSHHAVFASARIASSISMAASEVACETETCETPTGVYINDVLVSGTSLRAMTLENAQGGMMRAGDIMGDDGTVSRPHTSALLGSDN